jgi:sugar lactone lactonase YvrE
MTRFLNRRATERDAGLSVYWDRCVGSRGETVPLPSDVDHDLAAVIRDLESLVDHAAIPAPELDRGLATLLNQRREKESMSATAAYPAARPRAQSLGHVHVRRKSLAIAASILIVLAVLSAMAVDRWYGSSNPDHATIQAPAIAPAATPDPNQIQLLWQWNYTNEVGHANNHLQIAESPSGQLYVSDDIQYTIFELDADGNEVDTLGGTGPEPGNFNFGNPNAQMYGGQLGFDNDGNLYVFDSAYDRVQKFSPDNTLVSHWEIPEIENPNNEFNFRFVVGAVDPINERVYVAAQVTPQVYVYDLDGNLLSSWGTPGRDAGQLSVPSAVAVAGDGTLWIADQSISRIQHFDPDGNYLGSIGERGGAPGQINQVLGLAIDQDDNIYVAEAGNGRVQILRPDGSSVMVFNSVPELGRIIRPNALWVGSDGVLYVADAKYERVIKLRLPSLD